MGALREKVLKALDSSAYHHDYSWRHVTLIYYLTIYSYEDSTIIHCGNGLWKVEIKMRNPNFNCMSYGDGLSMDNKRSKSKYVQGQWNKSSTI